MTAERARFGEPGTAAGVVAGGRNAQRVVGGDAGRAGADRDLCAQQVRAGCRAGRGLAAVLLEIEDRMAPFDEVRDLPGSGIGGRHPLADAESIELVARQCDGREAEPISGPRSEIEDHRPRAMAETVGEDGKVEEITHSRIVGAGREREAQGAVAIVRTRQRRVSRHRIAERALRAMLSLCRRAGARPCEEQARGVGDPTDESMHLADPQGSAERHRQRVISSGVTDRSLVMFFWCASSVPPPISSSLASRHRRSTTYSPM